MKECVPMDLLDRLDLLRQGKQVPPGSAELERPMSYEPPTMTVLGLMDELTGGASRVGLWDFFGRYFPSSANCAGCCVLS